MLQSLCRELRTTDELDIVHQSKSEQVPQANVSNPQLFQLLHKVIGLLNTPAAVYDHCILVKILSRVRTCRLYNCAVTTKFRL